MSHLFFRKKFDSLKYDVKKVEEVVYDLSIRGLLKEQPKEEEEEKKEPGEDKGEKEKSEKKEEK